MTSWIEDDTKMRLSRAAAARPRKAREFQRGDMIVVIRQSPSTRKIWREGPGVVIMVSGTSTWCSVKGELWKINSENLRLVTSEEKAGVEQVEEFLPDLRGEIYHRRQRQDYWDISREAAVEFSVPTAGGSERVEQAEPREVPPAATPSTRVPDTPDVGPGPAEIDFPVPVEQRPAAPVVRQVQ